MPIFTDGSKNILSIQNPGVYVDKVPPTAIAVPTQTNLEGYVGVASWGPVGGVVLGTAPNDVPRKLGNAQIRPYDIASYLLAGTGQGSVNFASVRVSDGTDTAATAVMASNGGTWTAKYTGTLGNQINVEFLNTAAAGAYAAVVQFPGQLAERYDNIRQAVYGTTITAGTGFTSVPGLTFSSPGTQGGVTAQGRATLKVLTASVTGGGTGWVAGDVGKTITLANGVILTIATLSGSALGTVTLTTPGSLAAGAAPTTAVPMASTTGSGSGATFGLTWGLGPVTITNSGWGYVNAPTATLVGGGGTGGAVVANVSFWAALAYSVNNGTYINAKSGSVVFTAGSGTSAPTLNTVYTLTGGTDGDAGVTSAILIGSDTLPRTGMFALRGTGFDGFTLCDCFDPTTWSAQLVFAQSEGGWPSVSMPQGTDQNDAVAMRATQGIDSTDIQILVGDFPYFYDTVNGVERSIGPSAVALGLASNLSPEQGFINKALTGINSTDSAELGIIIADEDESVAQTGGVDWIGKATDLNQDYFSFLTGRNASSNTAAQGLEYTRLTNFLAKTFEKAGRAVVGKLQSIQADDPTRSQADAIFTGLLSTLQNPVSGSGGYGMIDEYAVQCDLDNNPKQTQALGLMFLFATVEYLNVVRVFVVKLAGGGNVSVSVSTTPVDVASLVA